MTKKQIKNKDF